MSINDVINSFPPPDNCNKTHLFVLKFSQCFFSLFQNKKKYLIFRISAAFFHQFSIPFGINLSRIRNKCKSPLSSKWKPKKIIKLMEFGKFLTQTPINKC